MNDLSVYVDGDGVKPTNPFAQRRHKQHSPLEIALEVLQTITCRKGPSACASLVQFSWFSRGSPRPLRKSTDLPVAKTKQENTGDNVLRMKKTLERAS